MDILLGGATGRMGKEILSFIENEEDLNFVCAFGNHDDFIRKCTSL